MIRPTRFFLLALLVSTGASAADNRIRTLRYDANQIVSVPGKAGIQSTIEFGPDEHIESVAVGNSEAWQVTPNRRASLLFVKPLVTTSRTNMTVVTDQRTYMFDLVTGRGEPSPIYALKFSYPEDVAAKAKIEQAKVAAQAQVNVAVPPPPPQLNFSWKTKGAGNLTPARVFDDGTSLYLAWERSATLPAISTLAEDGREGALNYRVAGDYIVVSPVPGNVVLRYGRKSATAYRVAPEAPSTRGRRQVVRQAQADPVAVLAEPAPAPTAAASPAPAATTPPSREAALVRPQIVAPVPTPAAPTPTPDQRAAASDKLAYQPLDNDLPTGAQP